MDTNMLLDAINRALTQIGRNEIIDAAPEMRKLFSQDYSNDSLAKMLIDNNNITLRTDHLYSLFEMLQEMAKSGQLSVSRKKRQDLEYLLGELDFESRYIPYEKTAGILLTVVGETATIGVSNKTMQTQTPEEDIQYLRVIGVTLGQNGPTMSALDSLSARRQVRGGLTPDKLATAFSESILNLWRKVIDCWRSNIIQVKKEESPEIICLSEVPDAEQHRRGRSKHSKKGKKRARSSDADSEQQIPLPRRITRRTSGDVVHRPRMTLTPSTEEDQSEGPVQVLVERPLCHLPGHMYHPWYRIPPVPQWWPATVYDRVRHIPIFHNPPCGRNPDINYTFIRERFSNTFGTPPQGLEHKWPYFNGKRERYLTPNIGSTLLISANTDFNPYVPRTPCAAGLIFRLPGLTTKFGNELDAEGRLTEDPINTLLVRLDTKRYLYVGEYRATHAGSLTLQEWNSLPNKQTWIKFAKGRPHECNAQALLDKGGFRLEVYELQCVDYHRALQRKIIDQKLALPASLEELES